MFVRVTADPAPRPNSLGELGMESIQIQGSV